VLGSRIGLALALASLSVAAVACRDGGGHPTNDASTEHDSAAPTDTGGDTSTPSDTAGDAAAPSDGAGDGTTTPGDAMTDTLDAGSGDAGETSDAGPLDGSTDLCAGKVCGRNQVCDPTFGACRCADTFVALPGTTSCVSAVCNADGDCDDGNPCNGTERCDSAVQLCLPGTPVDCGAYGTCVATASGTSCQCASGSALGAHGTCVLECPSPLAPDLSIIADSETLNFAVSDASSIELAVLPATAPIATATFQPTSSLSLSGLSGLTRVLARTTAAGCDANVFDAVYDVRTSYAPSPPDPRTTALSHDDPKILGWAQGCAGYLPGAGATNAQFMMPSQALGPAGTNTLNVVSLGNGGSITLTFGAPITDGDGWDFAVYENSFAKDVFLELGYVEVSSDGIHFARFDSAFRGPTQPCANCSGTAAQIGGLAGAYMIGYGTPFDLAALRNLPLVRGGTVDLGSIKYVRIVDVIGDGTMLDSFGRAIIDPLSGGPTAGFDLDGIAVLNQRR
jgi:hypothetical protein